jgi:hypothetical protein
MQPIPGTGQAHATADEQKLLFNLAIFQKSAPETHRQIRWRLPMQSLSNLIGH